VKTGPTDRLDIPDIFAMPQDKVDQLLFADPDRMRMDPAKMTDDEIAIRVRNRETLALIAWEPWMHNPKLPHRLQRAAMPTLLIRGEKDGLVSAPYLERYAKLFPRARLQTIAGAGHAPQVEQPKAFADALFAFLEAK
jgi:pimeloyl-ACP methyl ester carboxylesterase